MLNDVVLIYCPFPSPDAARMACHALLNARLIACGNLLPATQSHYWWEGELTVSEECILIAKTAARYSAFAIEKLSSLHPYACPAILRVEATANPAFAAWVGNMTRDSTLPQASD